MTTSRRNFFTAIAASIAALKVVPQEELSFPKDSCVLCGFDKELKPWNFTPHDVLRCTDKGGCQARQINALLGTRTPWQERSGVSMAKGKLR